MNTHSIHTRLSLVTAGLMLIALVSVTLGIYLNLRGELIERMSSEIREVARMTASSTGDWIKTSMRATQAGADAARTADPAGILQKRNARASSTCSMSAMPTSVPSSPTRKTCLPATTRPSAPGISTPPRPTHRS